MQQPRAGVDAGDPSLATEILPGPPSMASVIQAATKRDPRKPGPTISYLPQHDPGTTYTGMLMGPAVGSLEGVPDVEGPRRKRARVDKGYVRLFFWLTFFLSLRGRSCSLRFDAILCPVYLCTRTDHQTYPLTSGWRPIVLSGRLLAALILQPQQMISRWATR